MTIARVIGIALVLLSFFDDYSFGCSAATKPIEVFQGDIVELKIPGVGLTTLEGRMGKTMIPFFSNESGFYTALVGADIEAKPGLVTVTVKCANVHGDAAGQPNFNANQTKVLQEGIVFGCRRIRSVEPGGAGKNSQGPRPIFPRFHDFHAGAPVGRTLSSSDI